VSLWIWIKNMFWNYYFYSQQSTYLVEFRCNFTLFQAHSHGDMQGQCPKFFCSPQILLCLEKFVLMVYRNESKNLASLTVYFALQASKPGYRLALCQPKLSNLWHSEQFWLLSLQMLVISVHMSTLCLEVLFAF